MNNESRKMRYLINEQIYFDMAVETLRLQRLARIKWLAGVLQHGKIKIMPSNGRMMLAEFRKFKRCGRARP